MNFMSHFFFKPRLLFIYLPEEMDMIDLFEEMKFHEE